jgi:ABC-type branched-subunit amino acid transport system substrate-binding protein
VSKATKLVQQNKVAAILGTSTIETLALSPMADRLNVPIITSNSGGSAITRRTAASGSSVPIRTTTCRSRRSSI